MSPDDPRHGKSAGYSAHMAEGSNVCDPCRRAKNDYNNHLTRQRAYGRWTPFVDAEPVRAHVRELMGDGTSVKRIAAQAGVHWQRVSYMLYGRGDKAPATKVRPEFAAAVLAVQPDPGCIPVFRVARRLQGLIALGYTQPYLAAQLGVTQGRIWQYLNDGQENVTRARFDSVAAMYDRLSMTLPPESTTAEKYAVSRARNTAKRNGYLPPLCWDEQTIDDPDATPAGAGYTAATRADALTDLFELGVGVTDVCARLKVSREALEKWCRNHNMSATYSQLVARESTRYWVNQHGEGGAA